MPDNSTVCIVDDDRAVLSALTSLLTAEDYAVRAHESARTFLDMIQQDDCGCVVTDVRMPGMSGLDLLAKMKERSVSMPVIVITAHGDVPLAIAAMKRGAKDFFEKPFDGDALLDSIRAALAREESEPAPDAETQHVAGAHDANKAMGNASENSALAFTASTSDATGKSRRSIEIANARGEALGDDLGAVEGTLLDKGVDAFTRALRRPGEPHDR
ncbi:MAG: response regulator transcription factor [Methylocystis sp.]